MTSIKRWADLCKRQNLRDRGRIGYFALYDGYSEPKRHYHNWSHIGRCLEEVDAIKGKLIEPDEVEFALWFHDAVYNPTAKDNEERSAEIASFALDTFGANSVLRERVSNLILATKHQKFPEESDSDARYLVDIDFSIIGAPEPLFIETEKQIRKEYSMYNDEQFKQGRIKFLESAIARPQTFCTDYYLTKCEAQARINLKNALKRWQI